MLPGPMRTYKTIFIMVCLFTYRFYLIFVPISIIVYISLVAWTLGKFSGPVIIVLIESPMLEEVIFPVVVGPENQITSTIGDKPQSINDIITEPIVEEDKRDFPFSFACAWGLVYLISLIFRN